MPQVIIAAAYAIGAAIGGSAVIAGVTITLAQALAFAATIAVSAYTSSRARRKARDAYNASLQDRLQMIDVVPDAPRTIALGRVRAVEGVRRRWTSGEHSEKLTLVVSFAGHEIDAFEHILFNDVVVELDGDGYVQTAPYLKARSEMSHAVVALSGGTGSHDTGGTIITGSASAVHGSGLDETALTVSVTGTVINVTGGAPPGAANCVVSWQALSSFSAARVRLYRGTDAQNVGADLAAEYPGNLTATDRFAGIALAVVDLVFDPDVYPQGVPNITAIMRGARVLDPRTGTTAWSENNALLAYHYARWANGWAVPADEIRTADVIAAANECQPAVMYPLRYPSDDVVYVSLPRYRCGIVISTAGDPRGAMDEIMESMAGRWGWAGGTWRMRAGMSAAPVFALTPEWIAQRLNAEGLAGDEPVVRITNGVPRESKVNAISGTCVDGEKRYQVLPFPAIRDPVLIATEGEYLAEVEMQGVNHIAHAQHLAAIAIREAQASLRMELACNYSAYKCELFDVGTILLPRYGMTAELGKLAEVIGWGWHPTQGVSLRLAETAAAIYLPGELKGVDPAPNTTLPSPFDLPMIEHLTANSDTTQLLRQIDGTIVSRIKVVWDAVTNEAVRSGGHVDIRYGRVATDPATWPIIEVRGDMAEVFIAPVQDNAYYSISARASNSLVRGQWCVPIVHRVLGKIVAPSNVASISHVIDESGVVFVLPENPDLDRNLTELRVGASWLAGVPLVGTVRTRFAGTTWTWQRPSAGAYTVWAKYIDTSGNFSGVATSHDVIVDAAALILWGSISGRPKLYRAVSIGYSAAVAGTAPAAPGLHNAETGVNTHGSVISYNVAVIARSTGNVVGYSGFNVYSGAAASSMAAYLLSQGSDKIVVVWTYDEPRDNRLTTGLDEAMYYCGASRGVFGSPNFHSRAAYCLVGIAGCGEGNGSESYQGDFDSDANAWTDIAFQVQNGMLIGPTTSAKPRTLRDYAYLGDLNATADISLVARGSCQLEGNASTKVGGSSAWDSDVYSRDSYTGAAFASIALSAASAETLFGLNDNPASDSTYTTLNYHWYVSPSYIHPHAEATPLGSTFSWAPGDVLSIVYDGTKVAWMQNGVVRYSQAAPAKLVLFFDSSFYLPGSRMSNIRFGPLTARNRIWRQSTAPGLDAVDNDLWFDTDDGNKQYTREAGAWVLVRDAGISAALVAAANAQSTADGKINSYYANTAPSSADDGDLWFDIDDGNKIYVWQSGAWYVLADTRIAAALSSAATAQATADGKITTYFGGTAPSSPAPGDLWFYTPDQRMYRWSGSAWVLQSTVGAGDIGTGNLADHAATEVYVSTVADVDVYSATSANIVITSISYTATVDCECVLTTSGWADHYANLSQWGMYAKIDEVTYGSPGGLHWVTVSRNPNTSVGNAHGSLSLTRKIAMSAGDSKTFYFIGCSFCPPSAAVGSTSYFRNPSLMLEVVKK
jgi:hypothetical protein